MYTFDKLEADIVGQNYNAVSIGKSVNGRDIYAIKVGNGGKTFFITRRYPRKRKRNLRFGNETAEKVDGARGKHRHLLFFTHAQSGRSAVVCLRKRRSVSFAS